jgi:hypothetical protein
MTALVDTARRAPADFQLAEHAAAIRRLGKRVVADVIEIGRRLSKCKDICGHGNWLPWLDREFEWTEQTALNYMRLAELNKSKPVLDWDLPVKALYLLAAPSTPPEARDEIIERAQAGEAIKLAEVKASIAAAKQLPKPEAANVQARESGRAVLANDGYLYLGATEEEVKEGNDQRTMVYDVRDALDDLASIRMTAEQFLDYAFPHQLWKGEEAEVIKKALRWLASLDEAWDARSRRS